MSKKRLQYAYDAVGNRSLLVDPDGGRFTYAYDSVRRISHLEDPQNERTSYVYDAAGRRTLKRLANGTRASFSYDAASNLTRLANLKSNGTTISSFDYAYDKTGNRSAVLEADGSRITWSYDATYQLSSEHRTGSSPYRNTFTYDATGNRTLKNESGQRTTYAYDAANQLKTAQAALGTTTYTFDADGNQQIVQPPTGPRTTTVWDYENRTTLVELATGLRNTMAYEPDGLRIKLEDSTGTKKFVWDDQNYLAETDEIDTTQVVYTNEPAFYGNLISQRRSSTTHWYHFDAIGSTRQLTLANEAVSDTYLYDAWGVPIASTGATPNPFRFVGMLGYYFDVDTLNDYVRRRILDSALSRWTSRDPLGPQSTIVVLIRGQYAYADNTPLAGADPSGLITCRTSPTIPPVRDGTGVCVRASTRHTQWTLERSLATELTNTAVNLPGQVRAFIVGEVTCYFERRIRACYKCNTCCFSSSTAASLFDNTAQRRGKQFGTAAVRVLAHQGPLFALGTSANFTPPWWTALVNFFDQFDIDIPDVSIRIFRWAPESGGGNTSARTADDICNSALNRGALTIVEGPNPHPRSYECTAP